MYASLISAGASQLYDLYKSVTGSSSDKNTSKTSFNASSTDASSTDSGAVRSTSSSGLSFSSALQKLFVDLQASTSASGSATNSPGTASSTDPTNTIAGDLQTVFKAAKTSGVHGHHHAGPPPDQTSTDDSTSGTSDTLSSTTSPTNSAAATTNPFQGLASSLLAYAKTQSLTASASTSLTA